MFKKSLLAASILLVTANSMAATSVTASGKVDVFGKEFIANETTGITFSTIKTDLDTQYSVGDIITLSVTGASFDTTNSTPTAVYSETLTANPTMTLGLLSKAADKVTFRVTAASGNHGDTEAGKASIITFAGLKLTTASAVVAGNVTATFSAQTSTGIAIDSASTNAVTAMKGVNQYLTKLAVAADKLDAQIKVGNLRHNFGTGVYTDALKVTFADYTLAATEAAATGLMGVAPSATKTTLKGDFSFFDTNGDGKLTSADKIATPFAATAGTTATSITVATDLQSVSFAGPTAFNTSGITITAGNAAGDTIIKNQSFTIDTDISYAAKTGGTVKKTVTAIAAGAWSLDGKTMIIPYMPYGDNTQVILRITNNGTVSGNVSLRYLNETTTKWVDLGVIGTSTAGQVQNFSALVIDAIKADSGASKGKVSLELTVNAPSGNIAGYAAYKVISETDRGFVGQF